VPSSSNDAGSGVGAASAGEKSNVNAKTLLAIPEGGKACDALPFSRNAYLPGVSNPVAERLEALLPPLKGMGADMSNTGGPFSSPSSSRPVSTNRVANKLSEQLPQGTERDAAKVPSNVYLTGDATVKSVSNTEAPR